MSCLLINKRLIQYLLCAVIILLSCASLPAQDYIQAPAVIHISSTVSDGKYPLPYIVSLAKENKIKVVIITDRDLMRWEYGLWPLRNVIKRTLEDKSVFTYGISRYLEEIEDLQKRNPGLIIMAGLESAPFYYWTGSIFAKNLKIYNWHEHLLVVGLDTAKSFKDLPVIGNKRGLALPLRIKNIFLVLLIISVLVFGVLCLFKRQFTYKDEYGRCLGPFCRRWQCWGAIIIILGLLAIYNNYPFSKMTFDQYKGDLGIKPYQNFIDYVNRQGGLTFWAHPEASNIGEFCGIKTETKEHVNNLLESKDYTGFCIFYEGYRKVGLPGGVWDSVLREYCKGIRGKPVWAIGGLSFDSSGNLNNYMKDLRNVLLLEGENKKDVLGALKEGRLYVIQGKNSSEFNLDKFIIKSISSGKEKTMGQEIALEGTPQIQIKGLLLNGQNKAVRIKLIKNGKIIEVFEVSATFDIIYEDKNYKKQEGKAYYRLEIESEGLFCVTNPIFVI